MITLTEQLYNALEQKVIFSSLNEGFYDNIGDLPIEEAFSTILEQIAKDNHIDVIDISKDSNISHIRLTKQIACYKHIIDIGWSKTTSYSFKVFENNDLKNNTLEDKRRFDYTITLYTYSNNSSFSINGGSSIYMETFANMRAGYKSHYHLHGWCDTQGRRSPADIELDIDSDKSNITFKEVIDSGLFNKVASHVSKLSKSIDKVETCLAKLAARYSENENSKPKSSDVDRISKLVL